MSNYKIGLLPLYLALYDRDVPQMRPGIDAFRETIIRRFEEMGMEVAAAPVCRVRPEFEEAVAYFEREDVDALVTLHLAYSPSLESAAVLSGTKLPLIVLDTTPAYGFGPSQEVDEINYNHGIHGVQDLCSLLKRYGKEYHIEAGHWEKSDVLERAAGWVRAARVAKELRRARVGRIGQSFEGMGDFFVPAEQLQSAIGIQTVQYELGNSPIPGLIREEEIVEELRRDRTDFDASELDPHAHRSAVIASLIVRKWIEQEKLTAFTVNFLAVDKKSGIPCMPFIEAGRAMAAGLGYAGEGDVLTAALVGALACVYDKVSFTEMFCPDWERDAILLSHMGEMNLSLCAEKPKLMVEPFPHTDAEDPVIPYGRFREGDGVLVNVAPGPDHTYSLIVAPVRVLGVDGEDKLKNTVHGWFRPSMPVQDFLKAYSEAGGTHHIALVYGSAAEELLKFGRIMGWKTVWI